METAIDEDYFPFGATNYPVCERNEEINKMIKEELEKQKKIESIENMKNSDKFNFHENSNSNNLEKERYESIFEIIRKLPSRTLEEKTVKRRLLLEFHNLRKEVGEKKEEIIEIKRKLQSYENALALVAEPKHYLIAKLRDEEDQKKVIITKHQVSFLESSTCISRERCFQIVLFLSYSLFLCLSLPYSLSLPLYSSISLSPPLSLSLSFSHSLSLSLSFNTSVSLCPYFFLSSFFFLFSFYYFFFLSFFLSYCHCYFFLLPLIYLTTFISSFFLSFSLTIFLYFFFYF